MHNKQQHRKTDNDEDDDGDDNKFVGFRCRSVPCPPTERVTDEDLTREEVGKYSLVGCPVTFDHDGVGKRTQPVVVGRVTQSYQCPSDGSLYNTVQIFKRHRRLVMDLIKSGLIRSVSVQHGILEYDGKYAGVRMRHLALVDIPLRKGSDILETINELISPEERKMWHIGQKMFHHRVKSTHSDHPDSIHADKSISATSRNLQERVFSASEFGPAPFTTTTTTDMSTQSISTAPAAAAPAAAPAPATTTTAGPVATAAATPSPSPATTATAGPSAAVAMLTEAVTTPRDQVTDAALQALRQREAPTTAAAAAKPVEQSTQEQLARRIQEYLRTATDRTYGDDFRKMLDVVNGERDKERDQSLATRKELERLQTQLKEREQHLAMTNAQKDESQNIMRTLIEGWAKQSASTSNRPQQVDNMKRLGDEVSRGVEARSPLREFVISASNLAHELNLEQLRLQRELQAARDDQTFSGLSRSYASHAEQYARLHAEEKQVVSAGMFADRHGASSSSSSSSSSLSASLPSRVPTIEDVVTLGGQLNREDREELERDPVALQTLVRNLVQRSAKRKLLDI